MSMIKIDGQEYDTELMSVAAKENLQSVQFVDNELQRLQARAAVLQTARISYVRALQQALNPPAPAPFAGDTIKLG